MKSQKTRPLWGHAVFGRCNRDIVPNVGRFCNPLNNQSVAIKIEYLATRLFSVQIAGILQRFALNLAPLQIANCPLNKACCAIERL
jgi:hypothetical protein